MFATKTREPMLILSAVVLCCPILEGRAFAQRDTVETFDESANPATKEFGDVDYARAQLRLAKALLARSEERNVAVRGSVSESRLNELRATVELTQTVLASAEQGEVKSSNDLFLRFAYNEALSAEQKLKRSLAIRESVPDAVSDADLEVFRARAEYSKVELQMGRQAVKESETAELRWKLDLLLKEIIRIRRTVGATTSGLGQ